MALDHGTLAAQTALHHVGIDGALSEKIDLADLFCLGFKDADELLADDLALALGVCYPCQLVQENLLRVDPTDIHMKLTLHHLFHLITLVQPQQAVVHKDAGQPVTHCLLQQGSGNGAVYAAGQGQQNAFAADFLPALPQGSVHIGFHGPLLGEAADAVEEILQDFGAILRVHHLRVELHTIELLAGAFHRRVAAAFAACNGGKARGGGLHLHAMAHPVHGFFGNIGKQGGAGANCQLCLAVFPGDGLSALAA